MSDKVCLTCWGEYPASELFCPRDGTALRSNGPQGGLVGSVIAERYHVTGMLGKGGMGMVYLAEHVKMGRRVALKVMHPSMSHDANAITRFNREAASASRLSHQNVCAVYDFGETPEGMIYLAMEYIDGEPLSLIVERTGGMPPAQVASIIRQSADALQAAHDMGIVHRDLKPDNIMVAKGPDGGDVAKVVDFGIAKAGADETHKVTQTGLVIGTPEYMSPEQATGGTLDGRSDIYSLGLVAFQCLTGTLPFESASAQEAMVARLTAPPKTLADAKPLVAWSPKLEAALAKALARTVEDRYQRATEFGQDIARAVADRPAAGATGARATAGAASGTAASALRVLVIDDHAVIRRTLRVVLGGLGITDIAEADTVDAAERLLRDPPPFDVVFCDLNLPGRTGIDLLRAMPGLSGRTAVILLSGEDDRILRSVAAMGRASGLHVLAAISKPPTAAKIGGALSRLDTEVPGRRPSAPGITLSGEDVGRMISDGLVHLHYLPKVELATGAVVGVEALLRAQHPVHGMLPPALVLQAAQTHDLAGPLTYRVLREALATAERLRAAGLEIAMSVHLDAQALAQAELPDAVQRMAAEFHVPLASLTLEVAEAEVFSDYVRAIDMTTRLRLKRCHLSIDHFGAGPSGLRQLQELPCAEIKLDRMFVAGCDAANPDGRAIVEATVGLARALGVKTVATGVETAAEYEAVSAMGVDYAQGYHIVRPMPGDQLVDWIGAWAARQS